MKNKDGQVRIIPYESNWKEKFLREGEVIAKALEGRTETRNINVQLEHIGSTSIPGLPSKPVVDIILGLPDFDFIEVVRKYLTDIEYELHPYQVGDDILTLKKGEPVEFHLHVLKEGTSRWNEFIIFRDALRENEQLRSAYIELKEKLSEKFANDRPSYTAQKGIFIRNFLDKVTN